MNNMKRLLLATALLIPLSTQAGTLTGIVIGSMMNGSGETSEKIMTFSYNPYKTIKCSRYDDAAKICALPTELPKKYKKESKCAGYDKCYKLDYVVKHITGMESYLVTNITRFSKYTLPVYVEVSEVLEPR